MKINDENFIRQLRLRNENALRYVIDEYGGLIKSIVSAHLFSLRSVQEECMNDILLGIWHNINSYDCSKSTFKNWVAGISKYKAIDYKRKYLKQFKSEVHEETEIIYHDDAIEALIEKEMTQELEEMLNCLNEADQELFRQLFWEDKPVRQVSQETGMKPEVIYNRVSRGKSRLRRLFSAVEEE